MKSPTAVPYQFRAVALAFLPYFFLPHFTCASANSNLNPVDVSVSHTEDNLLTRWKKPKYPFSALRDGITGQVTIEFEPDKYGGLSNARVVSSNPPGMFDEAVLKTLSWWTVVPFRSARCVHSFPRTRITVNFGIEKGSPTVVAQRPIPLTDPESVTTRGRDNSVAGIVRWKHFPKPDYPLEDNRLYPLHGDVVASIVTKADGSVDRVQIVLSAPHPAFGQEVERVVKGWLLDSKSGEPMDLSATLCTPFRFRPAE